jgi:hypothetical protein
VRWDGSPPQVLGAGRRAQASGTDTQALQAAFFVALRGAFALTAGLRAGAFLEAVRTADLAAFGAFARDLAGAFALEAVFVFVFVDALAMVVSLSPSRFESTSNKKSMRVFEIIVDK